MVVLGICDNHDAGAALFVDGKLIAAVNEERLNRKKLWGGFPVLSIREVLGIAKLDASHVDRVVLGTRATPSLLLRALPEIHRIVRKANGQFGYLLNLYTAYQSAAHALRVPEEVEARLSEIFVAARLVPLGIRAPVRLVDHHRSHAAAAWATAPFDKALVVTVDGMGDGISITVSVGERGAGLRLVHERSGLSALTRYYSRLTEFLGFTGVKDEGKINALAACTDRMPALDIARRMLSFRDGRINLENPLLPVAKGIRPWSDLHRFSREEVAASFQRNLEDVVRDMIGYWLDRTGTQDVALAGGLFANVKLNQRIAEMDAVRRIWVFPHMGDGGLAAGGGFDFIGSEPAGLHDVYLGPAYAQEQVLKLAHEAGLNCRRPDDLPAEAARMLARGRILARYAGPMEYGPRALGNRSILVQAGDPKTIEWLNDRLKRSRFMPFAPAVHASLYDDCFPNGGKGRDAARFMTISFDASPRMKRLCAGAVHADGTCRPQRVGDEAPAYGRILKIYAEMTGIPAVINTSFNMHEEPIVDSPAGAIDTFLRARLHHLLLDDWIIDGRDIPMDGGGQGCASY